MSSLSNTMPLGGLEALVAAASAAKQASGSEKRTKKQRKGKDDQPAVQEASPSDTAKALASLFSNQIFVQALAASSQHAASGGSMPIDPRLQFQAPPLDHHNIQSANGNAGPSQYTQSHTAGHGSTPFQQTRSGRISRPPLVPPSYNLLQALASEADSPNFDALLHAVSGTGHPGDANSAGHGGIQAQGSTEHHTSQSRAGFWHQNDATNGFEGANTLAEVEQTANATRGNKRALSSVEGDEEGESSLTGASNLPAWPLPPMGPGGRKNMPKEELLARRRARNRVSALQARQKKREFFGSLETQLKEKEAAYTALEAHCHNLESQLEQLRQIVQSAGLPLPSGFSTPNLPGMPAENAAPQMDFITDLAGTNTSSWNGFQDDNLPSFDMFFNMDMDGEEDGEFLPPSSPQNESDDERPTPSTVQGKETPRPTGKNKGKGKGKSKRVRINADGSDDEDDDDDDDEGDDFVDEDEEDEDLFLPIEDVPVPPDAQVEVAMRSLGVDNQEELARLINKMVVAGKEGMTSEMVDKLKVLLSLVGPNGGWTGGVGGPLAADDSVES